MYKLRHLSTYIYGYVLTSINALIKLNPYSAGINFSRQNLTSVDGRFWRLKSIPTL